MGKPGSGKNGVDKFTEKMSEKTYDWLPPIEDNELEADEDGFLTNPRLKDLNEMIDDANRGPKAIEIVSNGVMELVSEEVTNVVEEFKDIMSQCQKKLASAVEDFDEIEETVIGLNDEFLFLTDNFGNKPEDNKNFSDKVKNEMVKYDNAWIEHSPEEGKINPAPNLTPAELAFGVDTYDMNFGTTVDIDGIYINGQSVKSIFGSVEPQNEQEAQKLTDYKKAFVTASAMGREDKIDFRFTNPKNANEKSGMFSLKTSVPNEMKNVSFWGEVGNFMSALGKGDFGKMKSCLDNLKMVTGLSSTKDKKHENQMKTDAIAERSDRRHKIDQNELNPDGRRVEKKRIEGSKAKVKIVKKDEMENTQKSNDPRKKK